MKKYLFLIILLLNVGILNAQKGKLLKNIVTDLPVESIQLSPDQKTIAVVEGISILNIGFDPEEEKKYKIYILNKKDLGKIFEFYGNQDYINSIDYSFDSKYLIATGESGVIYIWDLTNGTVATSSPSEQTLKKAMFISSSNEFIAIQQYENNALLYDINGNLIAQLNIDQKIIDLDFNHSTNNIYFGCNDELQIWSLISRQMTFSIPLKGLTCMSFNHNYTKLAIGTESGEIILFSSELKEIHRLQSHFKPVLSISFSLDDKKLASASTDQTARLWDLKKYNEILELTNEHKGTVSAIEFISEKYEFITGGKNKEIKIWK